MILDLLSSSIIYYIMLYLFNGLVSGKIYTGNHGFYHQIDRVFSVIFSHHPILWCCPFIDFVDKIRYDIRSSIIFYHILYHVIFIQWIGLRENLHRKPWFLPSNWSGFLCKCSHHPILCCPFIDFVDKIRYDIRSSIIFYHILYHVIFIQWIGLFGKIYTGNHGFYHQIDRVFSVNFPIIQFYDVVLL